ncbi:cell division protein ZipA [Thiorhodococcus mannitoliphagus]|uniref:Cell division protein ZipA n=1 Tax=Thiorhodococcus mannitoliphagus TaxID=329406 RepID=A0A6P1DV46_9GAMM|nr:cell division protein ZipA C-terminal FtsZ-binding domain-containing protein [Thiorhodococcus mannitoliphagus]NEX22217.1 cell division protein ZipA [Thiorhodococcus mannitoliphagus]
MDASTIRLILIVVGALLILLLYLWERYRERQEEDYEEDDFIEEEDDEDLDAPYGVYSSKHQPEIGDYDDEFANERSGESSWSEPASPVAARGDDDFESEIPAAGPEPLEDSTSVKDMPRLEPLLIQVSISARRYPFKGTDLMEVAERCGLYPGDMDIFHCLDEFDDHTRVYFSMANMVKPGTFPFDAMESFTTPGLMLFAQLEGDPEDMTILDEMTATARKLALALNGDVLDEARRPLTVKKEEGMRQAVLDNEMRWAKALIR